MAGTARIPSSARRAAPRGTKPRSKAEAVERVTLAVNSLPKDEAVLLAMDVEELVPGTDAAPTTSALTGEPAPSAEAVAHARIRNVMRGFAERRALLADSFSAAEVAGLLGVTRQTPHDRRASGTLVAVQDSSTWRFPSWQFDPESPDGVLPGVAAVLAVLGDSISGLSQVRWFVTPKDGLGGRTPLQALGNGEIDRVVAVARSLGAS